MILVDDKGMMQEEKHAILTGYADISIVESLCNKLHITCNKTISNDLCIYCRVNFMVTMILQLILRIE